MELFFNNNNPIVASKSVLFNQPIHNANNSSNSEYKLFGPFGSAKETEEERNFIENIYNILPRDDDLYNVDHFLNRSSNENGTDDDLLRTGEDKTKNYSFTGGKDCEDFSTDRFSNKEGSIWSMRSQNKSPPQCLACRFCSHQNNMWNKPNHVFQNKPAIPVLFPQNSTPILPHPYHNQMLRVGPATNHIFPHEIYFPTPTTRFGVENYSSAIPILPSFDGFSERKRRVRNDGNGITRQFEIDTEKVRSGEDTRTTLMLKNIPNRYTCEMLLATIDENHRGTYDFIYLPIDFKNKCNVGYAFINLIKPCHIIPFYETFEGKKWGTFSSQKVASLAYARIQGKFALISHFQNSSLMSEDKQYRPLLFYTNGLHAGKQEPFPFSPKG